MSVRARIAAVARHGLPAARGMSLRARIAAVASISVALAVIAAAAGMYVAVRSDLRGEIDSQLRHRGELLIGRAGQAGPQGPGPGGFGPGASQGGFPHHVEPQPLGEAGLVEYLTASGALLVPEGEGSPPAVPVTSAERLVAQRGGGESFSEATVEGVKLRVLALGSGSLGAIVLARPLTAVDHELAHLLWILLVIGAGGVLLAALLGVLVARTALAPIARFTRRAESLSGRLDLSQRVEAQGRDELARLARSFNETLDALERSIGAQRQLVADASHELRTPLTSLRTNIQVLAEGERLAKEEQQSLIADILAELDQLTALVADVVDLARGASPPSHMDEVRLDEVVRAAVENARRRGEVRYELDLAPTVVEGQAERIARAVSNVIDNARKWSPPSASVEVRLRDGVLEVRDHGPGFRQQDLPLVFDRFYRARDARSQPGSGLGLAIVRQAAEASGGFAQARNAPGGGALLRVGFGEPLALEAPESSA